MEMDFKVAVFVCDRIGRCNVSNDEHRKFYRTGEYRKSWRVYIIELAETVLKMTNSSSKLVKVEARPDDPWRRRPDITLAKEKLGWEPEIKLKEGLKPNHRIF